MWLHVYTAYTYLALRLFAGLTFACYGTQKLLGWPIVSPHEEPLWVTGTGGLIELVGGLCIAVGAFTRWAAFLCSGMMAVAYWMVHAPEGFFPIANDGTLAVLYCFIFLYIAAQGPGQWSLDNQWA